MTIPALQSEIIYLTIGALIARADNARTHPKRQQRAIFNSIRQFGFLNPVLIDSECRIVCGHARVDAARQLGLTSVPTIMLGHLSKAKLTAYMVADNAIADQGGWDREKLKINFLEIEEELSLDLTITGFDDEEIARIKDMPGKRSDVPEPAVPELELNPPATSRLGDVWVIEGGHRLICQDARDPETYRALLSGRRADLVITDPPWNLAVNGHVSGLGKHQHREFVMASGEMTRAEFARFVADFMRQLVRVTRSGSVHYIFIDWRSVGDLLAAGEAAYDRLLNLVVWAKTSGGMGSLYRSQHELVAVFCNGKRSHINNVELGRHGRNRTNVWTYPGANTFSATRDVDLSRHPTVKPTAMIADAIRDASDPGDLVLDAFAGSGTCLFAAQETGRCSRLIELDPVYVDVIAKRARDAGLSVTLEQSGEPLAAVIERRQLQAGQLEPTGVL